MRFNGGQACLVASLTTEVEKFENASRHRHIKRAVLLVLGPMLLLAGLTAVEYDLALAALKGAILTARARCTSLSLSSCHDSRIVRCG